MRAAVVALFVLAHTCLGSVRFLADDGMDGYWQEKRIPGAPSVYHMAWLQADEFHTARLAFNETIQGEIAMSPSWADIVAMPQNSLAHLRPEEGSDIVPSGPGSMTQSGFITMFPAGVLIHQGLMGAKGVNYSPAKVKADILMVGFGTGSGPITLYHHFPLSKITIVELEPGVVQTSKSNYPLLKWLIDDKKALEVVLSDGVKYLESAPSASRDVIMIDVYTEKLEFPPGFLTPEFMQHVARVLRPDGVLYCNLVGNVEMPSGSNIARVLMATQLAGLRHAAVFGLYAAELNEPDRTINRTMDRNMMLAVSRSPLRRAENARCWKLLEKHTVWPQFAELDHLVGEVRLGHASKELHTVIMSTEKTPLWFLSDELRAQMSKKWLAYLPEGVAARRVKGAMHPPMNGRFLLINDPGLAQQARKSVLKVCAERRKTDPDFDCPRGWQTATIDKGHVFVFFRNVDLVYLVRRLWADSVQTAARESDRWLRAFFSRDEVVANLTAAGVPVPLFDLNPPVELKSGGAKDEL